jgi:hypothetical protein
MSELSSVREKMKVIGADGVPLGIVEKVEEGRIRLTRESSGEGHHTGHSHYVRGDLVAEVHGDEVRLSANAANALIFQEEEDGSSSL